MNPYITKLQEYLENNPQAEGKAIFKILCEYYMLEHGVDTVSMKRRIQELDQILRRLPISEHTRVTDLVCELCGEHMQESFLAGMETGFRLSTELGLQQS